jgi:ATP-dependent protease ClpP protease subunit
MVGEIFPEKNGINNDLRKFTNILKKINSHSSFDVRLETLGGSNPTAMGLGKKIIQYQNARCYIGSHVASSGILFLVAFGEKNRFAHKNAKFKFHYPKFQRGTPKENQERSLLNIKKWISNNSKLSLQDVDDLMKNEKVLSAGQAIDSGLIYKIR